jgi:DNA repair ATPase RecN
MTADAAMQPLDLQEQLARITRYNEETRKFIEESHKLQEEARKISMERDKLSAEQFKLSAERDKLSEEQFKLSAEALKLTRDRSLSGWQLVITGMTAGAALVGATAAFTAAMIKFYGP